MGRSNMYVKSLLNAEGISSIERKIFTMYKYTLMSKSWSAEGKRYRTIKEGKS
jgi:hypothetical protein